VGAVPGPFETWLALRGMRTLHLRLDRAEATARVLAERLGGRPDVEEVRYPGFGGMLSVVVAGGAAAADALTATTDLWVNATSLGGVESTFERRRRWAGEPDTIPEGLVRLSVGIEEVEDLWVDLEQALDRLPDQPGQ
jgi:cystathionine gamma-synthase